MDEQAFCELISGRRTGLLSTCMRAGLRALSVPYGIGVRARNGAFDVGFKKSHRVNAPVVSVGNLTTGGTGKTPFVAHLVHWFESRGIRPALVSRGYRSLPDAVNDEKLVLDQQCPGVPHIQNADRVAAAHSAVEQRAQVVLLDDGFQHRRLARDLDIVLIDTLNPWGYGRLLPRGLLREPLSSLRRADLIVLTRADQSNLHDRRAIRERLQDVRGHDECVEVAFPPVGFRNASGETCELATLEGRAVTAFCGIGHPEGFRKTLEQIGVRVEEFRAFPDHHHYTEQDLDELSRQTQAAGFAGVVTTAKDLVKIQRNDLGGCPLWAVEIGAQVLTGGELLERKLSRSVNLATSDG